MLFCFIIWSFTEWSIYFRSINQSIKAYRLIFTHIERINSWIIKYFLGYVLGDLSKRFVVRGWDQIFFKPLVFSCFEERCHFAILLFRLKPVFWASTFSYYLLDFVVRKIAHAFFIFVLLIWDGISSSLIFLDNFYTAGSYDFKMRIFRLFQVVKLIRIILVQILLYRLLSRSKSIELFQSVILVHLLHHLRIHTFFYANVSSCIYRVLNISLLKTFNHSGVMFMLRSRSILFSRRKQRLFPPRLFLTHYLQQLLRLFMITNILLFLLYLPTSR